MGTAYPRLYPSKRAGVAELADAPGLGPGGLRPLEVQVLSPALMIRDRQPEDDAAIAQLIREVEPGWVTTERGVGHRRLTTPARARRRDWVAELDGEVVAWATGGFETDVERDDVAWLNVRVRPARRGRGIAAAL